MSRYVISMTRLSTRKIIIRLCNIRRASFVRENLDDRYTAASAIILYREGLVYYLSRFLCGFKSRGVAKNRGVDPPGRFGPGVGLGVVGGRWRQLAWASSGQAVSFCTKFAESTRDDNNIHVHSKSTATIY